MLVECQGERRRYSSRGEEGRVDSGVGDDDDDDDGWIVVLMMTMMVMMSGVVGE